MTQSTRAFDRHRHLHKVLPVTDMTLAVAQHGAMHNGALTWGMGKG